MNRKEHAGKNRNASHHARLLATKEGINKKEKQEKTKRKNSIITSKKKQTEKQLEAKRETRRCESDGPGGGGKEHNGQPATTIRKNEKIRFSCEIYQK